MDILSYLMSRKYTDEEVAKVAGGSGSISEEIVEKAINDYLAKNPIESVVIDTTLSKTGEAADAAAVGEKISRLSEDKLDGRQSIDDAKKLLHIGTDGVVQPLVLGTGLDIVDGMLVVTVDELVEAVQFVEQADGTVLIQGVAFTEQTDGSVLVE